MTPVRLTSTKYGKEGVRVLRVVKDGDWHQVAEYTISVFLEGNIETSFSQADNSVVVATDSMKNTVNVFAKKSPHVLVPQLFAIQLAQHFIKEYDHIHRSTIKIVSHRWSRIPIDSKPHPHSFIRDGNDTLQIEAVASLVNGSTSVKLVSGFKDLLVLKSTGSGFENFIRDKWTTLNEVSDRILSTSIDCSYEIDLRENSSLRKGAPIEDNDGLGIDFKELDQSVRETTLETFANDKSASVQATVFKMCRIILNDQRHIRCISYRLPNKHYVPVDLSWHENIQNTFVKDAEVFLPLESPAGLITATVSREDDCS
ncbi:hypothetical protein BY996DRAFT_4586091 [Phakopsora pachyrhizi]|uniref:Uricase n=1 Tax=Phakopsora pachyrhizi TaxID=170000 RepID=A0AAV0B346_PHAPC|nr:hypothetical protein BY996DRAFT_4586091 [Phakopsora pachyrhizi]CAH7676351.1 hypothetical protein PPACK8108_LOCUS11474 [Phakopsora pachyrhizi]